MCCAPMKKPVSRITGFSNFPICAIKMDLFGFGFLAGRFLNFIILILPVLC